MTGWRCKFSRSSSAIKPVLSTSVLSVENYQRGMVQRSYAIREGEGKQVTSLKAWARKAFLEEPPWPEEHFQKQTDMYIKELEANLLKRKMTSRTDFECGYDFAVERMLRFLRGES
jgi:hypothetical protein